jgi:methyl-accepting chemotaxis protein
MSITQRFNSLLVGAFICLAALAGLFILQMGRVYDAVYFSNQNIIPSILLLDDASRQFGQLRVRLYRQVLNDDPNKIGEARDSIGKVQAQLKKSLKDYEPLIVEEKDKSLLVAVNAAFAERFRECPEDLQVKDTAGERS